MWGQKRNDQSYCKRMLQIGKKKGYHLTHVSGEDDSLGIEQENQF